MSANLDYDLQTLGWLARRRQLATLGHGRSAIDRALKNGSVVPVCNGWIGTWQASQTAVIAVLHGAKLTGSSALRSYGCWSGVDRRVHLAVPPNSHRVARAAATAISRFAPPRHPSIGVIRHWAEERCPARYGNAWRVSPVDALLCFAQHESEDQLAAAIESAVHEKILSRSQIPLLFSLLPRRFRRLMRRLDFRSESGIETLAASDSNPS